MAVAWGRATAPSMVATHVLLHLLSASLLCDGVRPGGAASGLVEVALRDAGVARNGPASAKQSPATAPRSSSAIQADPSGATDASRSPEEDKQQKGQTHPLAMSSRKTWWTFFGVLVATICAVIGIFVWRLYCIILSREDEQERRTAEAPEAATLASTAHGPDAGAGGGPALLTAVGSGAARSDDTLTELRKRRQKILMEQVMARGKLEKVLEDIAAAEAQIRGEKAPSSEEMKRLAAEAVEATDMLAQQKLTSVLSYALPVLMQGQRLHAALEARAAVLQEGVAKMALAESRALCRDISDIFNAQHLMENLQETLQQLHLPSLAALLSMAFAPAQLRLLRMNVRSSIWKVSIFTFFTGLVMILDSVIEKCEVEEFFVNHETLKWVPTKPSNEINLWFQVDFALGLFTVLVRGWVLMSIDVSDLDRPPPDLAVENSTHALNILLHHYMSIGGEALVRLHKVYTSHVFKLSNWYLVLQTAWMIYGVDIVSNTAWDKCSSYGLVYLRIRTSIFLVLLVPTVLLIAWMFVVSFVTSEKCQMFVLGTAHEIDEFLGLGFPLAKVAVQVLFLHSTDDIRALQIRLYESKKHDVDQRVREAEFKLKDAKASQQEVDSTLQALKEEMAQEEALPADERQQQEFEQQQAAKDKVIGDASLVVNQIHKKLAEMSQDAGEQVDKWQSGEGPELVTALTEGRGLAHLQTTFGLDQLGLDEAAERAKELAGSLQEQGASLASATGEQEWAQALHAQGAELAQAAAGAAEASLPKDLAYGASAAAASATTYAASAVSSSGQAPGATAEVAGGAPGTVAVLPRPPVTVLPEGAGEAAVPAPAV